VATLPVIFGYMGNRNSMRISKGNNSFFKDSSKKWFQTQKKLKEIEKILGFEVREEEKSS